MIYNILRVFRLLHWNKRFNLLYLQVELRNNEVSRASAFDLTGSQMCNLCITIKT